MMRLSDDDRISTICLVCLTVPECGALTDEWSIIQHQHCAVYSFACGRAISAYTSVMLYGYGIDVAIFSKTRSQAIAKIANCTASQQTT